jgi:hypothetical protein
MQLAGQFKQAGILKETPAPSASGGEATSAPAEQRPERINAQPTSLESLEQQMASLLRRSEKNCDWSLIPGSCRLIGPRDDQSFLFISLGPRTEIPTNVLPPAAIRQLGLWSLAPRSVATRSARN